MTLYCDPKVKWGGMEVGGIRISHMSHIDGTKKMPLTETKGSKKIFTVLPLKVSDALPPAAHQPRCTFADWLSELERDLSAAIDSSAVDKITERDDVQKAIASDKPGVPDRVNKLIRAALDRVGDDFPGFDTPPPPASAASDDPASHPLAGPGIRPSAAA